MMMMMTMMMIRRQGVSERAKAKAKAKDEESTYTYIGMCVHVRQCLNWSFKNPLIMATVRECVNNLQKLATVYTSYAFQALQIAYTLTHALVNSLLPVCCFHSLTLIKMIKVACTPTNQPASQLASQLCSHHRSHMPSYNSFYAIRVQRFSR